MKKHTLLAATLLLATGLAHAEGFYVGGSAGFGDATLKSDAVFDDPDDKLFFAKGFGGYRISPFLAVEGSLVGASNDRYDDGFDGEADVSFGALTASLVGIIPVDDAFHIYGRVGAYKGRSEVDDTFDFFDNELDKDESGLVWGAGAMFNFGSREQFTVRVEFEEFDTDALDDLRAVNAAFQFNF